MKDRLTILQGHWIDQLQTLPEKSIHCCVTSPPYWGLRSYLPENHALKSLELGQEKTPEEYVAKLVGGFMEVRRVLRDDGTLWLNLGDSYAHSLRQSGNDCAGKKQNTNNGSIRSGFRALSENLKEKDLVGIPWRVAFALQSDGWYLRSDIIWHKPNPMPESVTDRPTKAHEYIFLLTKGETYFCDMDAIKEQTESMQWPRPFGGAGNGKQNKDRNDYMYSGDNGTRNKRSVWTVATAPYREAHFATFPPDLIKPCILAGTSAKGCCPKCGAAWQRMTQTEYRRHEKWFGDKQNARHSRGSAGTSYSEPIGTKTIGWEPSCNCGETNTMPCSVLDPFFGSGTTGEVALELGRKCIGIDLNPKYICLAQDRTNVTPGLQLA